MKRTHHPFVMTALALTFAGTSEAQTTSGPQISKSSSETQPTTLPNVVVTGNPLGSNLFELVQPTSTLSGEGLLLNRSSTLGETLSNLPGVNSTYFGPNASRPVIRGFDGDRVRIMQNGVGTLDVSALSPDHAVTVDPLIVQRAEVVRGPATLLYGGNAIGGVVNLLDNRIPQSPISGVQGNVEGRFGGAANERGGAAIVEGGNGTLALHADAYGRETDDLKIPGFARSQRLRASGSTFGLPETGVEQVGVLGNTSSHSDGGAFGASLTSGNGSYGGLSIQQFNSHYGSPLELGSRIDMRSTRVDFAGEARNLGAAIDNVKVKFGHSDYEHTESAQGIPQTTFKNRGYDGRIDVIHANIGPLKGAIGLQVTNFDFSALGAEAFAPQTHTDAKGVYVYEELPLGKLKFSTGVRFDRTSVSSQGGGPIDPMTGNPRFDPAQTRSFTPRSAAFGALYSFSDALAFGVNLAHTERAPSYSELYANGPHNATGQFEVGSTALSNEASNSADATLKLRSGSHSASIGIFESRFTNFITLFGTGNQRCPDGAAPADSDGDGIPDCGGEVLLPEFQFQGVPAIFRGGEAQGKVRVMERPGTLDLLGQVSYVKAYNRDTGQPLPRIPPVKALLGLEYRLDKLAARFDVIHATSQDRVSANELPTDAYTLVNASLIYRLSAASTVWDAFVKVNNLFNSEAREHTSPLKDIAPLPGRGVMVGLRGGF
ncbi:MAG: TonB-dependent receptor [Betaproteobacteria bacterium]|nr:TonB-dependent receptor [Betaproteobacteria bacterium]